MQKDSKKSSLVKRHVIGVLFLPVFFAYIYYLPPLPYFLALLGSVAVIALWEFYVMYKVPAKLYVPGILIGTALFYLSCRHPEYFFHSVFIGMFLILILRLFIGEAPSGCMSEIGPLVAGFFYISVFLSFQWFLRTGENGLGYIFLLYVATWLADSMAYYIGTYLGRNKLYPAVSPNKTIEGAFGSLIGGVAGVFIIKAIFNISGISAGGAVFMGIIIGTAALVGDLIESMFKRDAGVKDSSNFIPGHGGILDKIDGFLVAGPALYFIVRYF